MLSFVGTDELLDLPRRPLTGQSLEFYSPKCLTCHQWQSCGMSKTIGHKIVNECIHCHMPIEETNVIVSQTAGQVVHAKMRNHWIKIYANMRLPANGAKHDHP